MEDILKILLVEDSPSDVELTEIAFSKCKIKNQLFVLDNGEDALDFLYKRKSFQTQPTPDIILLDINIPRLNGLEVLSVIKNDIDLQHIPVVMLTTSSAQRDIDCCYANNANCYIIKPILVEDYLQAIQSIEDFWLNYAKLPKNKIPA